MRRQSGFSLLEVLIAVLVLAIGLLGLAALQTTVLRSNHSANLRTQATLLAYDMTDRLRANMAGFELGYYNKATAQDHDCVWDGSVADSCSANQMAQNDVSEWNAAVARGLPQGLGVVCLDGSPNDGGDAVADGGDNDGAVEDTEYECSDSGGSYAIKLWWVDEFDADGNPVIKRFSTAVQP